MGVVTSRGYLDAEGLGRLPTKEGGKVNFGNLEKKPVLGDEGVLGYTEEYTEAPSIKVTLIDTNELDKENLRNFVDKTIVYATNSGEQYTLKDAWVGNPQELNVKDGQIEVEFYGTKMIES
ncbi:phage tail tube protein [Thiomicrorhabdus sp.]|uniref:phage tail tube protein n=1 Tax=Thiomicrorhabdus sp. TaxID=2039724 RepID=UPI0035613B09